MEFKGKYTWEEWTCEPKKYQNIKWEYTPPDRNIAGWLGCYGNDDQTYFKIGDTITLNEENTTGGATPPAGVTVEHNDGPNGYEVTAIIYSGPPVSSWSVKCTAILWDKDMHGPYEKWDIGISKP